ncbi:MAG: hypothetical protein QGG40_11425 [Myxococcota bacterium]|jgi:hypothetical protein|nr:hypothetical protein [Myxococcota bacterium]
MAACPALAALLLWPLPLVAHRALITSPLSEGVSHLWGWWAAMATRSPFTIETTLINFPEGSRLELIDPLHLVPFWLGSWVSPALGFNLVIWLGLVVSGWAGWLLVREAHAGTGGDPRNTPIEQQWLATCIGLSCPTLLAVAVDGITESLGTGWVGVQLALLLSLRRNRSASRLFAWGLSLVACVHSGPYNAVWMALLDLPVGLWMLRHTRLHVLPTLIAAVLCIPYGQALSERPSDMPGGSARIGALSSLESLEGIGLTVYTQPWRAGSQVGADILDLFVPAPFTGAYDIPSTAYLGMVTLVLTGIGIRRKSNRWWLVGAVIFALLALGPWLHLGGEPIGTERVRWMGPAGWAMTWTPLGRLTRWYRAGAVALLLLIPIAARALTGRRAAAACLLVLLDARWFAPLPATLPTQDARPSSALLDIQGPVAELPPVHPLFQADRPAHSNLLQQVFHGQAIAGTAHREQGAAANHPTFMALRRLVAGEPRPNDDAQRTLRALRERGFVWIAVYKDRVPTAGIEGGRAPLGPVYSEDESVVVFEL